MPRAKTAQCSRCFFILSCSGVRHTNQGTATNNGVILWATNEDVNAYDLRFYSRENATNKPKLVVTWSNTPKTVYFLKDHLGSTRATVDQTGAVVGYEDYDPWGYALGRPHASNAVDEFAGRGEE